VQHVEYVPFGEVFVEERNNSWNTPYLFNGKELDEETGLYYYGARYYNPRESIFLSVDQMVEMTMTPYQYTYQNPINYTDPTGMMPNKGVDPTEGNETELPEIVITGQRSTSKVGIKHSYWNGYTENQGAASIRLHTAIRTNPATNDIDHQLLDGAGMIPVFGEVFDGINAGMYAWEGDYLNASLSASAMIPFIGWGATGAKMALKSNKSIKLYRAVSKAELDDIAKNGVRLLPGGYEDKLFAMSKKDASNFGYLNFGRDETPFTIIQTSIPKKFESLLYKGEMDGMKALSVPGNLLKELSSPKVFNHTSVPFNNFGRSKWNTYWKNFNKRHGSF
ncbi:RHS repeat-associated core domain-containing protein, partial [Apibacter sp. HY039]|uniref:RHS repeat-associated core domain-containing protein n=1 Tax=Apibacter sp. HY039 TaxID=2501476 RepID=UPI0013E3BB75